MARSVTAGAGRGQQAPAQGSGGGGACTRDACTTTGEEAAALHCGAGVPPARVGARRARETRAPQRGRKLLLIIVVQPSRLHGRGRSVHARRVHHNGRGSCCSSLWCRRPACTGGGQACTRDACTTTGEEAAALHCGAGVPPARAGAGRARETRAPQRERKLLLFIVVQASRLHGRGRACTRDACTTTGEEAAALHCGAGVPPARVGARRARETRAPQRERNLLLLCTRDARTTTGVHRRRHARSTSAHHPPPGVTTSTTSCARP